MPLKHRLIGRQINIRPVLVTVKQITQHIFQKDYFIAHEIILKENSLFQISKPVQLAEIIIKRLLYQRFRRTPVQMSLILVSQHLLIRRHFFK